MFYTGVAGRRLLWKIRAEIASRMSLCVPLLGAKVSFVGNLNCFISGHSPPKAMGPSALESSHATLCTRPMFAICLLYVHYMLYVAYDGIVVTLETEMEMTLGTEMETNW